MLRDLYYRQCWEIQTSKRFRSGPVLAAFVKPPPQTDFAGGITLEHIAFYLGKPLSEVTQGVPSRSRHYRPAHTIGRSIGARLSPSRRWAPATLCSPSGWSPMCS